MAIECFILDSRLIRIEGDREKIDSVLERIAGGDEPQDVISIAEDLGLNAKTYPQ